VASRPDGAQPHQVTIIQHTCTCDNREFKREQINLTHKNISRYSDLNNTVRWSQIGRQNLWAAQMTVQLQNATQYSY